MNHVPPKIYDRLQDPNWHSARILGKSLIYRDRFSLFYADLPSWGKVTAVWFNGWAVLAKLENGREVVANFVDPIDP